MRHNLVTNLQFYYFYAFFIIFPCFFHKISTFKFPMVFKLEWLSCHNFIYGSNNTITISIKLGVFGTILDYFLQKWSLHLKNCNQKGPQISQKVLPWDSIFRFIKVLKLCVDLANHPSCMSKKVKIGPKTSLPRRSTGFGPNNLGPKFLGPFWCYLTPVQLDLKSKIIGVPY